jgi:cysteine-rich secretory family protein
MRAAVITLVLLITCGVIHASGLTRWTTTVKTDGKSTKLILWGTNPTSMMPACRCVAGIFKLGRDGESATHFTGTLSGATFNHPRAAKAGGFAVKIRKTRHVMGLKDELRDELHAILRGSGQVILREVKGGEWEIVGYSVDALGDLWKTMPRWRADPNDPPKPAAPSAIPDAKADGIALAKLINDYRVTLKLPRVPISPKLTKVAETHVRDLNVNKPVATGCNMHSWSKQRSWGGCCYDGSTAAARCMWVKPKEIAGYPGKGYEIAAGSPAGMSPELALEQWQGSPKHHEVMINKGIWTKPWGAMGVAVEDGYAVAWFGEEADTKNQAR